MSKVLVIYEEVPENILIYLVELEGEELQKMLNCHNKYVNSDDFPESDWLSNYLSDKISVYNQREDVNKSIGEIKADHIVLTGFYL